ncbi:MAG: hypothetical protein ABIO62_17320, partial [Paracoccaceae bacterium]
AQYYARVFAPQDLAKLWHGGRRAAERFNIQSPPPGSLRDTAACGLDPDGAVQLPPVFFAAASRDRCRATSPPADLAVVAHGATCGDAISAIAAALPGVRLRLHDAPPDRSDLPLIQILAHPATATEGAADLRDAASDWVRHIAQLRQAALVPGPGYCEVRAEDMPEPQALAALLRALILRRVVEGRGRFVQSNALAILRPTSAIVARIAGPLARDFGYGPTD